jgi:hypothetical protein
MGPYLNAEDFCPQYYTVVAFCCSFHLSVRLIWSSSGVKIFDDELLSSVIAYVVKYTIGPLDVHACLSCRIVFSLVVCRAACLVLPTLLIDKNLNCNDFQNDD